MKERIYEILGEIRPECDFASSDNFIEDGLMDSFDVIQLIDALEVEYNIQIDMTELDFEDISSVDNIIEIIKRMS